MPSRASRALLPLTCVLAALACGPKNSGFLVVPSQLAPANGSVYLPGGSFRMGTDAAGLAELHKKYPDLPMEIFAQETPAHDVVLAPFDIDLAEVTVSSIALFVKANPNWRRSRVPTSVDNGKYLSNWIRDTPVAADSALPVTFVSWYAAAAYCEWRHARLPTEAEYEYAAGAGHPGDAFPWGASAPSADVVNWSGSNIGKPVAVAHYRANIFGLYDMSGNVWEFTSDRWRDSYRIVDDAPSAAPADILAQKPAALALESSRHVIRGGSYDAGVVNLRVRYRDSHPANGAGPHVGFRCAWTANAASAH
jgi:formylglycine-generating enzyme required for sulfatase activity